MIIIVIIVVSIHYAWRYNMGIPLLHRREGIIITLIEVMDELGLQGISTREIAKRQGVSEATLFRHFKNKKGMMMAALEHFCQYDDDIIQTSINMKLQPVDSIKYFINAYAEYYENYPAITVILQTYDGLMCEPELCEKVKSILTKRTNFIRNAIGNAQGNGNIAKNLDSYNIAILILGGFREICLNWRMNKHQFSLKEKTMSVLNMVLLVFL
jgi:AcrR family transcriptional regulator